MEKAIIHFEEALEIFEKYDSPYTMITRERLERLRAAE
jgi:hypothetical protein